MNKWLNMNGLKRTHTDDTEVARENTTYLNMLKIEKFNIRRNFDFL